MRGSDVVKLVGVASVVEVRAGCTCEGGSVEGLFVVAMAAVLCAATGFVEQRRIHELS